MHVAERTQWRMIANLLWAYDIEPAIDEHSGKAVDLDLEAYEDGLMNLPKPFKVAFKPRSDQHAKINREVYRSKQEFLRSWE